MLEIIKSLEGHTLLSVEKLEALHKALSSLEVPGDVIEIGVWRGGSGAILASSGRTTYLCDTFQGVVNVSDKDPYYKDGEHSDTSIKTVQSLLKSLNLHAKIIQGTFPKSADSIDKKQFCFAHIDVDVYKSTIESALWIWDRLNPGCLIYFDDYYNPRCPGVTKAVNELSEIFNQPFSTDTDFVLFKKVLPGL